MHRADVIVLNGIPRSGKSAVARALMDRDGVHRPGIYDMEVDTSVMSADQCADEIERRRAQGPGTALERAAAVGQT